MKIHEEMIQNNVEVTALDRELVGVDDLEQLLGVIASKQHELLLGFGIQPTPAVPCGCRAQHVNVGRCKYATV